MYLNLKASSIYLTKLLQLVTTDSRNPDGWKGQPCFTKEFLPILFKSSLPLKNPLRSFSFSLGDLWDRVACLLKSINATDNTWIFSLEKSIIFCKIQSWSKVDSSFWKPAYPIALLFLASSHLLVFLLLTPVTLYVTCNDHWVNWVDLRDPSLPMAVSVGHHGDPIFRFLWVDHPWNLWVGWNEDRLPFI